MSKVKNFMVYFFVVKFNFILNMLSIFTLKFIYIIFNFILSYLHMKTFLKRALIIALVYLCYWLYTWDINMVTLFTHINYLWDMGSSYSSMSDSRFDVVNK